MEALEFSKSLYTVGGLFQDIERHFGRLGLL